MTPFRMRWEARTTCSNFTQSCVGTSVGSEVVGVGSGDSAEQRIVARRGLPTSNDGVRTAFERPPSVGVHFSNVLTCKVAPPPAISSPQRRSILCERGPKSDATAWPGRTSGDLLFQSRTHRVSSTNQGPLKSRPLGRAQAGVAYCQPRTPASARAGQYWSMVDFHCSRGGRCHRHTRMLVLLGHSEYKVPPAPECL